MTQTLNELVGDVTYFEAGHNEYVGMSGDGRTRSLAGTYFGHEGGIGLQFAVDGDVGSHFLGYLQSLNYLVYYFVLGRTFGREAQHGHFRIESGNGACGACGADGNLCQLSGIGHGCYGYVAHDEDTVLTVFGSVSEQQHGTRYAGDARSGLDDLQGRTQYVARRVASTGQLTVGVAVLYHEAT